MVQQLKGGTFAEEVCLLLRRWRTDTQLLKDKTLNNLHNSIHPDILKAVRSATATSTELFASPLNFNPSMSQYFSTHERDQLFGAGLDAYSHKWQGPCFAHPPQGIQECEKAVRWALAAARETTEPVLITMLLPSYETAPHERWLSFPEVNQLAAFNPTQLRYRHALHWTGLHPEDTTTENHWTTLVTIGNDAGHEQYLAPDFDQHISRRLPAPE